MYTIRDAEQVLERHATISSLKIFLQNTRCPREYLEFIKNRIHFVYPKTIWMRLSVENDALELKTRLNLPLDLASHLRQWFAAAQFRRIVFDFRNVTIFDLSELLRFLGLAATDLTASYYLCDPAMAPLLTDFKIETSRIYDSERSLLRELRQISELEPCTVLLPRVLTADSLDRALIERGLSDAVKSSDVVVFDMNAVQEIEFRAASMFTPYIYTLARRHGVLTSFTNFRRKVLRDLQDLRALRPISGYIIGAPAPAPPGLGSQGNVLPMHAFTKEQLPEISNLCLKGALRILSVDPRWLNPATRPPLVANWEPSRRRTDLLFHLLNVINELNENVARHADSPGCIMMRLNIELNVGHGLFVYIGDSGVGLARGLSRDYDLSICSHLEAARLAFDLREHRKERRDVGYGFGGRGLTKVREIIRQLKGSIRLQTGDAIALFSEKKYASSESSEGHFFVEGTHYNLFIPTAGRY
jgi:hypothetical protein